MSQLILGGFKLNVKSNKFGTGSIANEHKVDVLIFYNQGKSETLMSNRNV